MQNISIVDQLGIASALGIGLGFPVGAYGGIITATKLISIFPTIEHPHAPLYTAAAIGAGLGMTAGALAPLALKQLVGFTVGSFRRLSLAIGELLKATKEIIDRKLTDEQQALVTTLRHIDLASAGHPPSSMIILDLDSGATTILPRGAMSTTRRKAVRLIEMIWPAEQGESAIGPKFVVFQNGTGRRASADEVFELLLKAQQPYMLPLGEVSAPTLDDGTQTTCRP